MADVSKSTTLKDSAISEEIASFKGSCYSKAKQATELADNVQQSCLLPLQELIKTQTSEFAKIQANVKTEIDNLNKIDKEIKNDAVQYFKAAKDCEDLAVKY